MTPPPEHTDRPPPLEYEAGGASEARRFRGLNPWGVLLGLSWVPYFCGVVNASTMLRSYSDAIVLSHAHGTLLFMGAGVGLSIASLVGFISQRNGWGAFGAGACVLLQGTLATCMGLAAR